MITGLDHLGVAVRDFDAAVEGYRRLFAREPEMIGKRAAFRFPNADLQIAPGDDEGLSHLAFRVEDLAGVTRLLARRGLDVTPGDGETLVRACGLTLMFGEAVGRPASPATGDGPVDALDHVVIYTANPDRALGLLGAKLGLDLRLDRVNAQWGARQLFFRCGGAVVEVGASLKAPASDDPDRFGGLAWRVADPEAAQRRMAAAGFDVSEVRTGRKPGTRVFTVRDAPGGVPTLMLSAEPAPEPA